MFYGDCLIFHFFSIFKTKFLMATNVRYHQILLATGKSLGIAVIINAVLLLLFSVSHLIGPYRGVSF